MRSRRDVAPTAAVACAAVALVLAAVGLRRELTWYLAIDQYGYLTFARSLRAGRLTHDWPPAGVLAERLPEEAQADILAHTYLWRRGLLYSRYAPGYPVVLAAWTALGGESAAPFLNPVLLLGLFALTAALATRLLSGPWAGATTLWLLLLLPTYIHLWGITVIRDPLAHLCGLGAFFLLVRRPTPHPDRRLLAAGFLLGYATSVRPDAGMYFLPAAVAAPAVWRAAGRLRLATPLAALVGMVPLFVCNAATTGNPLRPPQMIEADQLLSTGPPRATVRLASAATPEPSTPSGRPPLVSGGGLRLHHLPRTLPRNVALLAGTLGVPLVVLAAIGIGYAAVRARHLLVLSLFYGIPALGFYSLWGRPDLRYLMGVHLVIIVLVTAGLRGSAGLLQGAGEGLGRLFGTMARRAWSVAAAAVLVWKLPALVERGSGEKLASLVALGTILALVVAAIGVHEALDRRRGARLAGLGLAAMLALSPLGLHAVLSGLLGSPGRPSAMPVVHGLLIGAVALAPLLSLAWRREPMPGAVWLLSAVGLFTLGAWLALTNPRGRAPFQRQEVAAGQATIGALIEPASLVITSEEAGRPAENIDYYTAARAVYLSDLRRWGWSGCAAAGRFLQGGTPVYFLLPDHLTEGRRLRSGCARMGVGLEVVAEARGRDAYRYFAASRFRPSLAVTLYRARLVPSDPRA